MRHCNAFETILIQMTEEDHYRTLLGELLREILFWLGGNEQVCINSFASDHCLNCLNSFREPRTPETIQFQGHATDRDARSNMTPHTERRE